MSPSSCWRPVLYPESGASCPPSSVYCCHRSVSRISAAARNRRMAASPSVMPPPGTAPKAERPLDNNPTPTVAALAAKLFFRKERRFACLRIAVSDCFIVFFSSVSKISILVPCHTQKEVSSLQEDHGGNKTVAPPPHH